MEITKGQIKKIHVLINILGVSDDNYRSLLDVFNVTTSKDLTASQAGEIIDMLEKHVEKRYYRKPKPKKFDDLEDRPGMATPKQLRMIEGIWHKISFTKKKYKKNALRHFIQRIAHVSDIRFLDKRGASKIINALVNMQKNQAKKNSKISKAKES